MEDPATPMRLAGPAAEGREISQILISDDDTRVVQSVSVFSSSSQPAERSRIERIDTAAPQTAVVLSHTAVADEGVHIWDDRVWARSLSTRVAYLAHSATQPGRYNLYVANADTAASGTLITLLPDNLNEWPMLCEISPGVDAALFDVYTGNSLERQLFDVPLTPGAAVRSLRLISEGGFGCQYLDNGASLAFISDAGLVIQPSSISSLPQVLLAQDIGVFSFSPDSQLLAFTANVGQFSQLWVMNRASAAPFQITGLTDPAVETSSVSVVPAN